MNLIKLIDKRALQTLIDNGYVNAASMNGISISSKTKKSRGKRYYAIDHLAFIAWSILGYDPDDKEYQTWKLQEEKRKKAKNKNNKERA